MLILLYTRCSSVDDDDGDGKVSAGSDVQFNLLRLWRLSRSSERRRQRQLPLRILFIAMRVRESGRERDGQKESVGARARDIDRGAFGRSVRTFSDRRTAVGKLFHCHGKEAGAFGLQLN